jgi:hypothetical protein
MSLKVAGSVSLAGQNLTLNVNAAIKKIQVLSNAGEQMELEEDAIKGLANLVFKKHLKSLKHVSTESLRGSLESLGLGDTLEALTLQPGHLNVQMSQRYKRDALYVDYTVDLPGKMIDLLHEFSDQTPLMLD